MATLNCESFSSFRRAALESKMLRSSRLCLPMNGGSMSPSLLPEILALPVSQRMELAAKIWESIKPQEIELTEEHRRILDERIKAYEANPTEGRPWEEVKADLFKKQ